MTAPAAVPVRAAQRRRAPRQASWWRSSSAARWTASAWWRPTAILPTRALARAIALAPPRRGDTATALDLDGYFALHPALAPLRPLWESKTLAVVHRLRLARHHPPRTSTPRTTWRAARRREEHARRLVGWAAARCRPPRPRRSDRSRCASRLPRSLRGDAGALAMSSLDRFDVRAAPAGGGLAAASSRCTPTACRILLHGTGRETFEAVKLLKSAGAARSHRPNGADYPRGRFGEALRQIAQLVRADVGLADRVRRGRGLGHARGPGRRAGPAEQPPPRVRRRPGRLRRRIWATGWRTSSCSPCRSSAARSPRTATAAPTTATRHRDVRALGGGIRGGHVYGRWPGLAPRTTPRRPRPRRHHAISAPSSARSPPATSRCRPRPRSSRAGASRSAARRARVRRGATVAGALRALGMWGHLGDPY